MASIDPLLRSLADYSTQFHQNRVQGEMSVRALKKSFDAQQQQALTLLSAIEVPSFNASGNLSSAPPAGQAVDIYV